MAIESATVSVEPIQPLLMGAKDCARLLGISPRHFLGMYSSGRIGPMPLRLGTRRLWSVDELRCWVAAGCLSREKWQAIQESHNA